MSTRNSASNTRSQRSHSSHHTVRHHDYPRLPNVNQKSWEWNGDFSILSNYLNRFWTHFRNLPELSSLSFLRGCIPDSFTHEVDAADTLEEALNSLSLWIEDSSIHSEKIYAALRNIADARDLYGDRAVLRDQLSLLKKGLQISGSFWLNLQQCNTYFTKYSEQSAYERMKAKLENVAHSRGDYFGTKNYALPLVHIIREQRIYVNQKLSCHEINRLYGKRHNNIPPIPPNILANTVDIGAEEEEQELAELLMAG